MDKRKSFSCKEEQRSIEIEQAVYEVISEAYGYILSWGILTGVRPVKIASRLMKSGVADEQIIAEYTDRRFVDAEKAKLCLSLAKTENNCLQNMPKNAVALYVHIPICPIAASIALLSPNRARINIILRNISMRFCKKFVQ